MSALPATATATSTAADSLTLRLPPRFDYTSIHQLRRACRGMGRDTRLCMDMRDVRCIDSSGLGLLLSLRRICGRLDRPVQLRHCSAHVRQMLTMARVCQHFELI